MGFSERSEEVSYNTVTLPACRILSWFFAACHIESYQEEKMAVYKETIKVKSHGGTPSYINITGDVRRVIEESGIKSGISCRFGPLLPR